MLMRESPHTYSEICQLLKLVTEATEEHDIPNQVHQP